MAYVFFYGSAAAIAAALASCLYFRRINTAHVIIVITSIAYSLIYDTVLGTIAGLYHYISPDSSELYMVMAAILIYPPLNVIYTLFIPGGRLKTLLYTGLWTVLLLLFEYLSVISGTVVLTGWRAIPWSVVTYLVSYTWIYLFYKYLNGIINKRTAGRA